MIAFPTLPLHTSVMRHTMNVIASGPSTMRTRAHNITPAFFPFWGHCSRGWRMPPLRCSASVRCLVLSFIEDRRIRADDYWSVDKRLKTVRHPSGNVGRLT